MKLQLTQNWWQELEANPALDNAAKDQLKAMISAFLLKTTSPTANEHVISKLAEADIEEIVLETEETGKNYLEVTQFIPDDKENGRAFTYLRKFYPRGQNVRLMRLS